MVKKCFARCATWVLMLVSMFMLFSTNVFAASRDDVITNFKVVDGQGNPATEEFDIWENFRITSEFKLPDTGVQAGDTTRITMPNTIVYTSPNTSFELKAPDGSVVANATVDRDARQILITYTNYASLHSGTTGSFYFDARINHDVVRNQGPVPLDFDVEGKTISSNPVNFEGVDVLVGLPLVKSSWPTDDDPQSVSYFVAINRSRETVSNVTFIDQLQNINGKIDISSIEIYKGSWQYNHGIVDFDLVGSTDVTSQFINSITQSADGQTVTIPFGNLTPDEGYMLLYTVKLDYAPVNGEEFLNTATVTGANGYHHTSAATATYVEAGGQAQGYNYTIEIHKENPAGEPLPNVTFEVIRKATNQKVGEITTGTNGVGQLTGLLRTEYLLREVDAPSGYQKLTTDIEVAPADFNATGLAVKTIVNQPVPPATTSVSVTKRWNDANNQEGLRQPVTVNLYKTVAGVKTLVRAQQLTNALVDPVDANSWKYTFANLPVSEGGQTVAYTVEEAAIAGYTTAVTGNATNGFVITNSRTPETVDYQVTKVWNDTNNQAGKRPATITVRLFKTVGGVETEVSSKAVTAADKRDDNTWVTTFTSLPKFENGQEIHYSVKEDAVADYTTAIAGSVITNTHTPQPSGSQDDDSSDPNSNSSSSSNSTNNNSSSNSNSNTSSTPKADHSSSSKEKKEEKQKKDQLPETGTNDLLFAQVVGVVLMLVGCGVVLMKKRAA